ncbi:MAG: YitT family protein [Eubacterium sp.]
MNHLIKRNVSFILGILINSFGIAFITRSSLGTSAISSLPYVVSLHSAHLSYGGWVFILNSLFILLQALLMRRDFHPVQYLQILVNLLFSSFIDVSMAVLFWLQPQTLPTRLLSLVIGCCIQAFGICMEVSPNVLVIPGEGIVRAVSRTFHIDFGKVKLGNDVTLITLAAIASLLFFHGLRGVGAGTIISAVIVGPLVSLFSRKIPLISEIKALTA